MTTYNTGKPIGSSSAKDLFDNAENLDRAVNDRTSRTWTDRLGRERVTLHAVETAVPDAINARNSAEAARDTAVLAKDAVIDAVSSTKQYVDGALSDLSTAANKFYPTKAEAEADIANITVNQPVTVGEAVNGGLWYKATAEATTLTKSAYDPLTQAKAYADAKAADITKSIDIYQDVPLSDFTAGSDSLGLPVTTDLFYKSPSYIYIPGSTITFSRLSGDVLRFGHQFSDDGISFNDPVVGFGETRTVSNPTAKYVRFYVRHSTAGTPLTQASVLSSGIKIAVYNYKQNQNRLSLYRQTSVFDSIKITAKDFELGDDDDALGAIASTNKVKTKPYYLKDGGVVTLTGSATGFNFQIAVSDNPNTGFGTKQSFTNGAFTVTADTPYFKIYGFAASFNFDAFKASAGFYFSTSLDLSRYKFDLIDKIGREDFYNLNEFKKFRVTESDFVQGLVSLGGDTGMAKSDAYLQTKEFKVKAGDTITISCPATTPKFLWNYGTGGTRVTTTSARADGYTETSFTFTVPANMNYIVFGARKQDGTIITAEDLALFKFTAVLNKTVADEKVDANTVTEFVPKKYIELTQNDFLFGEEDNIAYMTSRNLRSKLSYKMPIGGIAKLNITVTATHTPLIFGATQGDSYYAVARGPNPATEMTSVTYWTVTSSAGKDYFKIYVGTKDTSLMTVEQFKALQFTVKVEMLDDVVYQSDVSSLIYQQNRNQRGVTRFLESGASTYRTPSLAQGGVISFIDDDGRSQAFTDLYPVIKANDIPYGFAIIPSYVGRSPSGEPHVTEDQVFEMTADYNVEIMSHTWSHQGMSVATPNVQHEQLRKAKEWFIKKGIYVKSFVYPYGHDSSISHGIVNQYYESAYDFGANVIENFDTIRNYTIQRYTFNWDSDMAVLKAAIDQAHATNGWIIFTTHAGLINYWDSSMPAKLAEIVQYARNAGCKLLKPSDAFQIYGNILESDSGFKITAEGKIVGAS